MARIITLQDSTFAAYTAAKKRTLMYIVDRWTDALTVGNFLGTYSVRKSSQESISTKPIPIKFYGINFILSLLAPLICK